MTIAIETLKEKIARIQQELAEVSAVLEEMAAPSSVVSGAPPQSQAVNPLAGLKFADTKALRPIIDKAFTEMGIDITQPAPTPEEVQQLILREGVKPEDNILSRGIIEAREE